MIKLRDLTFVLSTRSYSHIGVLTNVDRESISVNNPLESAKEISFDIYKELNGEEESLWKKITPLRLLYVPELDTYYQIDPSLEHKCGEEIIITVTGTSLCECELGQSKLYDLNINNENDINWDNDLFDEFVPTVFYNPNNTKYSLLNRVLDKLPHYSIGHVDESLRNLQRSFTFSNIDVYGALAGDIAEQFGCIFIFD